MYNHRSLILILRFRLWISCENFPSFYFQLFDQPSGFIERPVARDLISLENEVFSVESLAASPFIFQNGSMSYIDVIL